MIVSEPKLVEYIKNSLEQGHSKEDIYKELLNRGHTVDTIQYSFNSIGTQNTEQQKEDVSKKTIHIIVTIGAVLIGVGIFSFIAANWSGMGKGVKVAILLISMFVSYGGGWYLKEELGFQKTGNALILLGSIIYGAGIFLVAQMFNIRANWPDGFILWMIGVIAMAFATSDYSLFYLAMALGVIVLYGHPFEIFNSFGYSQFLLTSSFLLLTATVVTFVTGWIIHKKIPAEFKEFY